MRLPCTTTGTRRHQRAFTLIEAMIAATTLVLVVGSVIACNLYGMAMAARQQIWLGASADSAKAISTIMDDVRSANTLQVGTYTNNTFTQVANNVQQAGNALLLYPTTNATPWTVYYYDPINNNLVRTNYAGAGQASTFKLVSANPITNDSTHLIFTEVDYTGTPFSNTMTVASVKIYLSFTELQDPQIKIANGSLFDLYQIVTVATPRL